MSSQLIKLLNGIKIFSMRRHEMAKRRDIVPYSQHPCSETKELTNVTNEPHREKTGLLGFRPGPTQTGLYSHRRWLEAWNLGFRK